MNNLVVTPLSIQATSKPSKSGWGRVQKLWQQIEKRQARNQRYDEKITNFLDQFRLELEGTEQEVCAATEELIAHLISFISRKSIKGSMRDTLYDWISEEFDLLEANPFRIKSSEPLREQYQAALSKAHPEDEAYEPSKEDYDLVRAEVSAITGLDIDLTDEQLKEMISHPDSFIQYLESLREQAAKKEAKSEDGADFDDDTFSFFDDEEDEPWFNEADNDISALFENKDINKLYKQLARQLHPDRIQDTEKKQQHHELMQQLSQAKKEKDIFGMLMLAQTWLPDFEMNLDEKALNGLTQNLQQKLDQLEIEYHQLKAGPDLKSQVWHRFGGGNKNSRKKELEDYRLGLTKEAQGLRDKIQSIRTVQDIQLVLRQRRDRFKPMFPSFGGPIDLSDIDEFFDFFD
ncbi:J domain-containing protein [Vibrio tritonius]|uniref:J domain-containing protein n=1 Tax=Vibrio tritonius TaxID=1435069 RepID=UPI0008388303|nr:J domain-containing protein [Vibrio tritonius]